MHFVKKIVNQLSTWKILVYFFFIIGWLLPPKSNKQPEKNKLLMSRISFILVSSIVRLLHLAWCVNAIRYQFLFRRNVYLPLNVFLLISVLINGLYFSCRHKDALEILNRITCLRLWLLNDGSKDILDKKFRNNSVLIFSISLVFWAGMGRVLSTQTIEIFLLQLFPNLLNVIMLNLTVLHYSILLLYIRQNLKVFNDKLLKFSTTNLGRTINSQNITLNDSVFGIDQLNYLYKIYLELYELSKKLSEFYSMPIFLCVIQMFAALTVSLYLISKRFVITNEKYDSLTYSIAIIYSILLTFLLVTLNVSASSVVNGVNLFIYLFI